MKCCDRKDNWNNYYLGSREPILFRPWISKKRWGEKLACLSLDTNESVDSDLNPTAQVERKRWFGVSKGRRMASTQELQLKSCKGIEYSMGYTCVEHLLYARYCLRPNTVFASKDPSAQWAFQTFRCLTSLSHIRIGPQTQNTWLPMRPGWIATTAIITAMYFMFVMYQHCSKLSRHCHLILTTTYEMGAAMLSSRLIRKLRHRAFKRLEPDHVI